MPKKRQIPRLFSQPLANGMEAHHWKPSKTLRKAGFVNVKLGTDFDAACTKANELNAQVKAWKAGKTPEGEAAVPRPAPRIVRFAEARLSYQASDEYKVLEPSTRKEYNSRLNTLEHWAMDGTLAMREIDRPKVLDLRKALLKGSPYRCAALLRVLRLFLAWCVDDHIIAKNVAEKIRIPEPPKRKQRLIRDDMPFLIEAAAQLAFPHIEIGCTLGFYTTQREGDLLATTRFKMKPVTDISEDARQTLCGPDGRVLGLTLEQAKTDTWVAIPLVPVARVAIESVFKATGASGVAHTHLISRPGTAGECPDWRFQRDFRVTANLGLAMAVQLARRTRRSDYDRAMEILSQARRLKGIQFRDLRRSGMCWMRDLGVPVPLIASISGHSIEQTQKILDTYLPRDTRAAAEAMAMAVSRQAQRDAGQAKPQLEEKAA